MSPTFPPFFIGFKFHFLSNGLQEALKGGQEVKDQKKKSFEINDHCVNYFLSAFDQTHKFILKLQSLNTHSTLIINMQHLEFGEFC